MRLRGPAAVAGVLGVAGALRRVAASPIEVAADLPGDDLVPDATVSMDRAATFDVQPAVLWPWIAQLGKGRGGWYFPRWLDAVTPPARRSLRHVDPSLTGVDVGDDHPDWGPGEPVLRVVAVEPGRSLVYHSLRDSAENHRWPPDGRADRPGVLAMSWVLVLTPTEGIDGGTRLHLRVRARARTRAFAVVGDVFDAVTVALLFAGLRERITP